MNSNIKNTVGYIVERSYPYLLALLSVFFMIKYEFIFINDANLNDMLGGVITIDSIIIGFLGAIMPVIMSMKNESKFVKYVFEKDKDNLFTKYIRATILYGLISAALTLSLYIRNSINSDDAKKVLFYVWVFVTILFIFLTYRSMSHMLTLVFANDNIELCQDEVEATCVKTTEEKELEKSFRKDF